MGDHRATISIRMEFHGKVYEWKDAWINYNGHQGVDERVIKFFEDAWDDGYRRWSEDAHDADRQHRESETRQHELADLARLKTKYETP